MRLAESRPRWGFGWLATFPVAELSASAVALWRAGLAAVDPRLATRRALTELELGNRPITVIAIGKAGASMALGARDVLGERATEEAGDGVGFESDSPLFEDGSGVALVPFR